jgi:hypothetical protein
MRLLKQRLAAAMRLWAARARAARAQDEARAKALDGQARGVRVCRKVLAGWLGAELRRAWQAWRAATAVEAQVEVEARRKAEESKRKLKLLVGDRLVSREKRQV